MPDEIELVRPPDEIERVRPETEKEKLKKQSTGWVKIYQKELTNTAEWEKICTIPSSTIRWRMSLIGREGQIPPDPYVRIAYNDAPGNDEWWPLFAGAEPLWRYDIPKHIYGRAFTSAPAPPPGPGNYDLVVIEAWLPQKMPSQAGDKEMSKLGEVGGRQV